MNSVVYFFGDLVICSNCGKDTLGICEEFSSRVECDNCGHAIIDYDGGDQVVLFVMEDDKGMMN